MPNETTPQPETITIGPFVWDREPGRDEETWVLRDAVKMVGMHWYVKNYGTASHPDSPFHGWRCGSGGPWPQRYESRDDAMSRVIPYLIQCMRDRVHRAREEVVKREAYLGQALGWQFRMENGNVKHPRGGECEGAEFS